MNFAQAIVVTDEPNRWTWAESPLSCSVLAHESARHPIEAREALRGPLKGAMPPHHRYPLGKEQGEE